MSISSTNYRTPSEGFPGMERELQSLEGEFKGKSKREPVSALLGYLRNHRERLHYCERLATGHVIGSGLIEEACKNLVSKRRKQTGAYWRLPRANRMVRHSIPTNGRMYRKPPIKVGRTRTPVNVAVPPSQNRVNC